MTNLIEKLRAATEGSRELDAELWACLNGGSVTEEKYLDVDSGKDFLLRTGLLDGEGRHVLGVAPACTTSLDAITALIREKLPGATLTNISSGPNEFAQAEVMLAGFPLRLTIIEFHSSLPLALCIALLEAMKVEAEQ